MLSKEKLQAIYTEIKEKCDVQIGNIFYHVDSPTEPWEVIRSEILGSGLYFWIASFENRKLRLCKRVELYKDSTYFTYFRTIKEAKWQQHSNIERKFQILTDQLLIKE